MLTETCYNYLNLKTGASLREIQAAYRRLAKENHPDAGGASQPDKVAKFIRITEAYLHLRREKEKGGSGQKAGQLGRAARPGPVSALNSRREQNLYLNHAELREGRKIVFSLEIQDVCPRCFGQGQTLLKSGLSPVLKPKTCPGCQGRGTVGKKIKLALVLSREILAAGKARLRKAGDYYPEPGLRGDLVINLKYRN